MKAIIRNPKKEGLFGCRPEVPRGGLAAGLAKDAGEQ